MTSLTTTLGAAIVLTVGGAAAPAVASPPTYVVGAAPAYVVGAAPAYVVGAVSARQVERVSAVRRAPRSTFVVSARAAAVRSGALRAAGAAPAVRCAGSFKGGRVYDDPRPGTSSRKRTIDAHLSVTCTGPAAKATIVRVSSAMHSGRRTGRASTATGRARATTGGDLACTSKRSRYVAIGTIAITYPPGYVPRVAKVTVGSPAKVFRRAGSAGVCVKG